MRHAFILFFILYWTLGNAFGVDLKSKEVQRLVKSCMERPGKESLGPKEVCFPELPVPPDQYEDFLKKQKQEGTPSTALGNLISKGLARCQADFAKKLFQNGLESNEGKKVADQEDKKTTSAQDKNQSSLVWSNAVIFTTKPIEPSIYFVPTAGKLMVDINLVLPYSATDIKEGNFCSTENQKRFLETLKGLKRQWALLEQECFAKMGTAPSSKRLLKRWKQQFDECFSHSMLNQAVIDARDFNHIYQMTLAPNQCPVLIDLERHAHLVKPKPKEQWAGEADMIAEAITMQPLPPKKTSAGERLVEKVDDYAKKVNATEDQKKRLLGDIGTHIKDFEAKGIYVDKDKITKDEKTLDLCISPNEDYRSCKKRVLDQLGISIDDFYHAQYISQASTITPPLIDYKTENEIPPDEVVIRNQAGIWIELGQLPTGCIQIFDENRSIECDNSQALEQMGPWFKEHNAASESFSTNYRSSP